MTSRFVIPRSLRSLEAKSINHVFLLAKLATDSDEIRSLLTLHEKEEERLILLLEDHENNET